MSNIIHVVLDHKAFNQTVTAEWKCFMVASYMHMQGGSQLQELIFAKVSPRLWGYQQIWCMNLERVHYMINNSSAICLYMNSVPLLQRIMHV